MADAPVAPLENQARRARPVIADMCRQSALGRPSRASSCVE